MNSTIGSVRIANAVTPGDFQRDFVATGTPVVLAGLNRGWSAFSRWDIAFFRERYGDLVVPVRSYQPDSGYRYEKTAMTLSDYLDYWDRLDVHGPRPDKNLYLAEWNFARSCPELRDDFEVPEHFADDWIEKLPANVRFGRLWLFFGHPWAHTPVHTDTFSTSAWLAMIHGEKAIRFLPPHQGDLVESGMDLFDPDTAQRLLAQGAELSECTIAPGQILFIPARWLHQVKNVDKNVMLTANFADSRNLLRFLSEFETRLLEPINALRQLRNEQCRAADAAIDDGFRQTQLAWADGITAEIDRYRDFLRDSGDQ